MTSRSENENKKLASPIIATAKINQWMGANSFCTVECSEPLLDCSSTADLEFRCLKHPYHTARKKYHNARTSSKFSSICCSLVI